MRYLVPIAAMLLSGCVTAEERAAREAQYREALTQECASLGFQRGTAQHGNCMVTIHMARERQRQAQPSGLGAVGCALQAFGAGVQGRPLNPECGGPSGRTLHCWRDSTGQNVYCQER